MITVKDLTVEYADGKVAVEGVGFTLAPGENVALVGANGAGKTSLLLALVGILAAKTGDIRIGSTVLGKRTLREIRSRVGLVFQNPDDQLFMPCVFEDVAFGPRSFGCDEAETERRAGAAMRRLEIGRLRDSSPMKLSAGEKRLCAIAAVLSMEPEFLLFDEPTAFLDPRARRNLASALADMRQGKLVATHDVAFAEAVCSRVLLLRCGRLVGDGGPELLRDTATLEAAGL